MRRVLSLASAFALAALPLKAQEMVTDFVLDNGMQVVVVEDHRAPVAMHMVWYKAGSADEPPGVSGIAHFLEHLMFKGTGTLEPGEFSKVVAENGGRDNAFTSYDYTAYHQRVAADRLELMMQMESDRMVNLRLTEDEILTERDVIIEERNQRVENSAGALFREQRMAAQYINHHYGIPIIGWRHEMEELSKRDALDFYEDFYAPNNAILVVAGDVQPDDVKALAEKYYGVIPANPEIAERDRPQDPPQTSARRMEFFDDRVAQEYVTRSYLAPERDPGDQKEAAALTMLANILGAGPNSVLPTKLQFGTKQAVYVSAFYGGVSLDDTTFNLVIVPAQGVSLEEAESAMDAAVSEFIAEGVDPEHLERIKMQLRADQIYARDSAESVGNRYGRALTSGLTIEDVREWPEVLQAISEDDIIAAAERIFDIDKSVTGWLMRPKPDSTKPEVSQ
ncbi:M16 family metallopeptidase [Cognatishimia activa]|uniref:Protease 3 n=1 Tax=Cognatishimia activa TaxID=1715691 RepID=A0A0P1IL77_9RHOB|nr:pitrilysin family protein [Cognatishimia activa]CUI55140.1 Protease 3 precursor [Cognatishimia activa]CUK24355.1 Protease 3 precursor [Cognatishimia activa]